MQNNDSMNSDVQDTPTHEFQTFTLQDQTSYLAEQINLFQFDGASRHQRQSLISAIVVQRNRNTPSVAQVISKALPGMTGNVDTKMANSQAREAF